MATCTVQGKDMVTILPAMSLGKVWRKTIGIVQVNADTQ